MLHTRRRAAATRTRRRWSHHSHLGVELEADNAAGRYRVTHVYEDGPADKDWVRVKVGNYLLAINGKQVKAGDEYWDILNSFEPQSRRNLQRQAHRGRPGTRASRQSRRMRSASCATSVG